jgi:Flp pilus assembly protein TadG
MRTTLRAYLRRLRNEDGTTLIETSIACGILFVTLAGLMSMGTIATMHTENQGHLAPRTTEYAQDKMEQLLSLAYGDATTNTVVFPAVNAGGSGLAIGGSVNTAAPVNLYVDWLASDGSLLGGGTAQPATWFYERVWQVSAPGAGLKQVTVAVTVRSAIGGFMLPKSTVVAIKSSVF